MFAATESQLSSHSKMKHFNHLTLKCHLPKCSASTSSFRTCRHRSRSEISRCDTIHSLQRFELLHTRRCSAQQSIISASLQTPLCANAAAAPTSILIGAQRRWMHNCAAFCTKHFPPVSALPASHSSPDIIMSELMFRAVY